MAVSVKKITIYAKMGFILNELLGEDLPELLDVATGFTAIAGEIAGDGFKGNVLENTSSEPEKDHITLNNNQWIREIKHAKFLMPKR